MKKKNGVPLEFYHKCCDLSFMGTLLEITSTRLLWGFGDKLRNLYIMLKFTERPKTLVVTSKKNMTFPEGIKLFVGKLCTNLDEGNADIVQFTKMLNWKWIV